MRQVNKDRAPVVVTSRCGKPVVIMSLDDYHALEQTAYLLRNPLGAARFERQPFSGIGKPEPLKHRLSGFWLRWIDDRHQLVHATEQGVLLTAQCRDHY